MNLVGIFWLPSKRKAVSILGDREAIENLFGEYQSDDSRCEVLALVPLDFAAFMMAYNQNEEGIAEVECAYERLQSLNQESCPNTNAGDLFIETLVDMVVQAIKK